MTGGAGYVGEMLCDELAKRDDVEAIVTIDKEPQSAFSKRIPKLTYIQANLADSTWQDAIEAWRPDAVVHTAWQIRVLYGREEEQWHWNVDGSDNVFTLALALSSVKKLIHFSTAASYAAFVDNTFEHRFSEDELLRENEYLYAKEKKIVEEHLEQKVIESGREDVRVVVLRPAAITGPKGRYLRESFGLQSALNGSLKGGFLNTLVKTLTTVMPATRGWVRQFIHEDDVVDAVIYFLTTPAPHKYEIYNLVPEGPSVYARDMARTSGKKVMLLPAVVVRAVFFCFWHGTRGKVPTAPHVWRFYAYPIVMSGKKLATEYRCAYTSLDALQYTDGRYEVFLPDEMKSSKGV